MTDRPIIFSAPMIRALLDGRKTQTRRVLKSPTDSEFLGFNVGEDGAFAVFSHDVGIRLPNGWIGDRIWCRESFYAWERGRVVYMADGRDQIEDNWRPSIHMPRWASRLTLTVTDVRVQRVQEITQNDCVAEGIFYASPDVNGRHEFEELWNSIYGPDAWMRNDWVAAYTFAVEKGNIDHD